MEDPTATGKALPIHQAQSLISGLSRGSAPLDAVEWFHVEVGDRCRWLEDIQRDLDGYIREGGSKVRFLKGFFGDGKTHFLSMVRKMARDRGYLVSYVNAEEAPLHKFEKVYGQIVERLEKADCSEQTLRRLLDGWVEERHRALSTEEVEEEAIGRRIGTEIREFATGLVGASQNFRSALFRYWENAALMPDDRPWEEENELILRWFSGETVSLAVMRKLGVYSRIDKNTSKEAFRSMAALVRALGASGLVILIDELELITFQNRRVQDAAYSTLRQLIDSADGGGDTHPPEGIFVLGAATPEMFEEEGFKKYPALWDRVAPGLTGSLLRTLGLDEKPWINPSAVVIDLDLARLDQLALGEIARKVREAHGIAYGWPATEVVEDAVLDRAVRHVIEIQLMGKSPPRILIKTLVELLDLARQYPEQFAQIDLAGQIRGVAERDRPQVQLWD